MTYETKCAADKGEEKEVFFGSESEYLSCQYLSCWSSAITASFITDLWRTPPRNSKMPICIQMCLLMHKCWRQTLNHVSLVLVPYHQTQQISFMPSHTQSISSNLNCCWENNPYTCTLGIIYARDKPHMGLIYVDQALVMLVTNLTSGVKPHGWYLLSWWQTSHHWSGIINASDNLEMLHTCLCHKCRKQASHNSLWHKLQCVKQSRYHYAGDKLWTRYMYHLTW